MLQVKDLPVFQLEVFFQICEVSELATIQKRALAKFGYRLESKVEKFRNLATCWQHTKTCYINMVTWTHFFEKKILL